MKGLGESAPLHGFSPETVEQAAQELARISRSLLGRNPTRDWLSAEGDFSRELGATGLSPSARFGFELAIRNLYAASEGKSLFESLCPSTVASVPVNGLLSGSLDEVLEEARRMRDAGYEAVKLKVGRRGVQEDAKSVHALREVLGENVTLRIDANRAWSLEEAAAFVRAVGDVRYEYIEEPLADPSRLAGFVGEHGVPVALDESLVGMPPEELKRHNYARAVVLKPTIYWRYLANVAPGGGGAPGRNSAGCKLRIRVWRRHGSPPGPLCGDWRWERGRRAGYLPAVGGGRPGSSARPDLSAGRFAPGKQRRTRASPRPPTRNRFLRSLK